MAEEIATKLQPPLENFVEEQLENEAMSDDEEPEDNNSEQFLSMDKNSNLHFSAAFGMIDTMKQDLESSDQKIDAQNFMGWTPLMMAIRNGHIEAVKILLDKGADITKKNKLGMNCFNLSIANGNHELVDTVLRHMLKGGISRNRIQENLSPISLAIVFKKTHLLRSLISQGFDLNAFTWKTGLTPLMFAAAVCADKIISVLELKGANAKARNYMGVSYQDILHWRRNGLENMRENCNVNETQLSLPSIDIRNKPIVPTKKLASPSGNNQILDKNKETVTESCGESASAFLSQEVSVSAESSDFHEGKNNENDQNQMNRMEGHFPPINVIKPHHVAPTRSTKDKKFPQSPAMRNDSPIIHHSYQYQSPYNGLHCPLYIPVMNSSNVSSPVTPMMVPSPYQNFAASVGDVAQNSPMNMMPQNSQMNLMPQNSTMNMMPLNSPINLMPQNSQVNMMHPNSQMNVMPQNSPMNMMPQNSAMNVMPMSQNPYQFPPMFFPSPVTRPDPNFSFDTNAINANPNVPNTYNTSPMFYAVYPNMQNVYTLHGPKP